MTVINTNVKSLVAQASLAANSKNQATAMERLSTGLRVNSAKDDAAGLAIGTRMSSQVRGLNMAIRNANDGISLVQTAEGAMEESTSMLQRMRELALQATNATYTAADRASIQEEISQLADELDRISSTTKFNGQTILDGSFTDRQLQIGDDAGTSMAIGIQSISAATLGERSDGPAVGATRAALEIQGMSTTAADYQSASFDVSLNGASATVTLPAPAGTTVTAATIAVAGSGEDQGAATSTVLGNQSFRSSTVDLSTHARRIVDVRVGSDAYVSLDMTNALNDVLGTTTETLNAPAVNAASTSDEVTQVQFLTALQSTLDAEFTGDKRVTASVDSNGILNMSVADGSFLTLKESTGAGVTGTFVAGFIDSAATAPLGAVDLSTHANTGFSLNVNGTGVVDIEFSDLLGNSSYVFDQSAVTASELQNVLQTVLDENFSGDNAVTATVDSEGFVNLYVAGGNQTAVIAEITDMAGTTGASTGAVALFGAVGTVDNNDVGVNMSALGINTVVNEFDDADTVMSVAVNTLAKVDIDMTTYLRAAAADLGSVKQNEMVAALQAAFDDNFTGDNAVTVTANGDGTLGFDVAGGAGFLQITNYDPIDGSTDGTFVTTAIISGGTLTKNPNVEFTSATYVYKGSVLYSDSRSSGASAAAITPPFSEFSLAEDTSRMQIFSDQNRAMTGTMAVAGTWVANDTVTFASAGTVLTSSAYTVTAADVADTTFETLAQNIATHLNNDSAMSDEFLVTAQGANLAFTTLNQATPAYTTITATPLVAAGTAGAGTIGVGTMSTIADITLTTGTNETLTIELDNSGVTQSLTLTLGTYSSLDKLADEINLQIGKSGQFEGDSAVVAVVKEGLDTSHTDVPSDTHRYLALESAAGKEIELTGTFVTAGLFFGTENNTEIDSGRILASLGSSAYDVQTADLIDGGVDTTAGAGVVTVSIQDGANTISRDVALGNQTSNRAFADFASDLSTAVNAAFASDGYSVTTGFSNGSFSVALDQTGSKTLTLSGTIVEDAFGSTSVSATGYDGDVLNLASMDDVVTAINSDLTAAGLDVAASFDSAAAKLVFTASGGDAGAASTVTLSGTDLTGLQFGSTLSANGTDGNATDASIADIDVSTEAGANAALTSIDNAITYVSSERSKLGAIQNRLDHTVSNLTNVVTNTEASRSRIMDADYGQESAALAKAQIIQQAATAMLAQANQSSQSVLSLLQ